MMSECPELVLELTPTGNKSNNQETDRLDP